MEKKKNIEKFTYITTYYNVNMVNKNNINVYYMILFIKYIYKKYLSLISNLLTYLLSDEKT